MSVDSVYESVYKKYRHKLAVRHVDWNARTPLILHQCGRTPSKWTGTKERMLLLVGLDLMITGS